ncbi:putative host specificity protein, partial [Escherichia coli FDA506]
RPVSGAG